MVLNLAGFLILSKHTHHLLQILGLYWNSPEEINLWKQWLLSLRVFY